MKSTGINTGATEEASCLCKDGTTTCADTDATASRCTPNVDNELNGSVKACVSTMVVMVLVASFMAVFFN